METINWKHSSQVIVCLGININNLGNTQPAEKANCSNVYKYSGRGQELSKVIRVRYENGVLKPLSNVNLEEGKEYKVIVEEDIDELIKKYRSVLGKSPVEEFRELEEEAQTQ